MRIISSFRIPKPVILFSVWLMLFHRSSAVALLLGGQEHPTRWRTHGSRYVAAWFPGLLCSSAWVHNCIDSEFLLLIWRQSSKIYRLNSSSRFENLESDVLEVQVRKRAKGCHTLNIDLYDCLAHWVLCVYWNSQLTKEGRKKLICLRLWKTWNCCLILAVVLCSVYVSLVLVLSITLLELESLYGLVKTTPFFFWNI